MELNKDSVPNTNAIVNDNASNSKKKRFVIVKRPKDKVVEYEEQQEQTQIEQEKSKTNNILSEYISQLSEQEQIVMKIASEHLKTSFDIEKSSGYLQYLRKKQQQ